MAETPPILQSVAWTPQVVVLFFRHKEQGKPVGTIIALVGMEDKTVLAAAYIYNIPIDI